MISSSITCKKIKILSTRHLKGRFLKVDPSKSSTKYDGILYYEVHNMNMDNTAHITCGRVYTNMESTL